MLHVLVLYVFGLSMSLILRSFCFLRFSFKIFGSIGLVFVSFTISQLGNKCLVLVLTKPSGLNAKENFRDGFGYQTKNQNAQDSRTLLSREKQGTP